MMRLRCFLALIAILVGSTPLTAQQPRPSAPPLPEGVRALRDLAYVAEGGHERQRLDLFLPAEPKGQPLIVWIHGGAWLGGSKANGPALRFLREGYAVASVGYRLSQHAPFPAQIEDCKAAIRWLRAHAAEYGYDGERIGVWGSSAGGHLVALLGTAGDVREWEKGANLDVSSRVQAVCDFFGPSDLLRMGEQAGPDSKIDHDSPDSPESKLVGGPIQADPARARRASPITYVSADDAPFLILHGDRDDVVPIGQSEVLHEALRKAGVESTFHVVRGAGHGFRDPKLMQMVSDFFRKHLRSGQPSR
jgi:acetyl esterase/lipase